MNWRGVITAITTNFRANGAIDHAALARHCRWQIESGCSGIVCCGSLGESATLPFAEKVQVVETCVRALRGRAPVALGVAALSTAEAVSLARAGEKAGCDGLMILPPYVYSSDWREMRAHIEAAIRATDLSCMLYNNPIAYRTDFLPEHVSELARRNKNLKAVKESSADVRRISAIKALLGERLEICVGVDDAIVEGVYAEAVGWIAGLSNAFPRESVMLFQAAMSGDSKRATKIYRWFLPLLRLDTVPKFVQYIKWLQAAEGRGTATVRPPRLKLRGEELRNVKKLYATARSRRPKI